MGDKIKAIQQLLYELTQSLSNIIAQDMAQVHSHCREEPSIETHEDGESNDYLHFHGGSHFSGQRMPKLDMYKFMAQTRQCGWLKWKNI